MPPGIGIGLSPVLLRGDRASGPSPPPFAFEIQGYAPVLRPIPAPFVLEIEGYAPAPGAVANAISFTHTGSTFAALLTVTGTPDILWTFADATTDNTASPSKDFGSAATRTTTLTVTPQSALTGINIGYDGSDGGSGSITHLAQQNVVSVGGLNLAAPYLTLWCSSLNPITSLDFTDFTALQTVECFQCADLASVQLVNTSAITRLCLEQCGLAALDVSDCTGVEDFRAAVQRGGNQEFDITWGVFPNAWHICVRDNNITAPIPMANFPHIEELWLWNCYQSGSFSLASDSITSLSVNTNAYTSADLNGLVPSGRNATIDFYNCALTSLDITDCPGISNFNIRANDFSQSTFDSILSTLEAFNTSDGVLDIRENVHPSSTGATAVAALIARGWTVQADAWSPAPAPFALEIQGYAPVLHPVPAPFALEIQGYAPEMGTAHPTPAPFALEIESYAPVLRPTPAAFAFEIEGYAPILRPTPASFALEIEGHAPILRPVPAPFAFEITGYAPVLRPTPAPFALEIQGYAPSFPATGPELTYIGVHVDENVGQVRTFSGVSIGTAAADRLVVVAVGTGGGESTPSSVTIGGTAATIHAQGTASGWQDATIVSRTVTTGTTADIVVTRATADGSTGPTVIAVYTITGLASTTPEATDSGNGDPIVLSMDVPEGAVMIACAHGGDANSPYDVLGCTLDANGVDSFYNYWFGSETGMAANATYEVEFSRSNAWSAAAAVVWL